TFSCSVDFGTAGISDFNVDVLSDDESTSASICEGEGTIASDATFQITGGTWDLNGDTPDQTMCYGSFYGSNVEAMGGAWGMYSSSANTGAAGIFQGDRDDPLNQYGYFTGMMRFNPDGYFWKTTFISTTMQPSGFDNAVAMDTDNDSNHYVRIENGKMTYWKTRSIAGQGDVEWTRTTEDTTIITNPEYVSSYMEWGNWTQPTAMTVTDDGNSLDHLFDTQGYYVWGDYTDAMPQTGSYIYSGPAYGTILYSNSAANMTGEFSTDVNFASGTLSNFGLTVAGGGYSASISGETGNIASNAFTLNNDGTWILNGFTLTTDPKSAYGSFYGPNAEAMGGVWQMGYGGGMYEAVGSFVSTSKTTP
ncbi:MAG: hypothetical protein JW736_03025, partial [Deltaproteobacteria bacterium]|nr:hypothetical protein [Deltaproteobacteria bacterium]